jgi:hypothetical protein
MELTEINRIASSFDTVKSYGRTHIIRPVVFDDGTRKMPNYLGTGKALVGVVKKKQKVEDWVNDWKLRMIKL